jgi:hypothetical protein
MSTSLMMCLQANGIACDEDEVNKVMGARPRKGASWESALAAAQHYGMRATLTTPATVKQLKAWTDQKIPVMIAWNPEGREWSHASVVYHVAEGPIETLDETQTIFGEGPGLYVWVADPNMPNPDKTTRIVHEDEFYGKWYEKWPDYLVRRPACAIAREITPRGKQVMAAKKEGGGWRNRQLERDFREHQQRERDERRQDREDAQDRRDGEMYLISTVLKGYAVEHPEVPALMSLPVLWFKRRSKLLKQLPAFLKSKRVPEEHARQLQRIVDSIVKADNYHIRLPVLNMIRHPDYVRLDRASRAWKAPKEVIDLSTVKEVAESGGSEKLDILRTLADKVQGWPEGLAHVEKVIAEYEAGRDPSGDDLKKIRNFLYRNRMREEANHFRTAAQRIADRWMNQSVTAGGRSPNQVGSSAMLKRQGLTPVDYMFGEALPHRRPVVMQGEELQDRRGKLWFFVGVGVDGEAILATDERDLKRKMDELVQERLHHIVGRSTKKRKKKRKPQSEKDKLRTPTEAPRRRNLVVKEMIEQGGSGAGRHHNRQRDVQRGRSRKVKHKEDLRHSLAAHIADRYLSAGKGNGKLDRGLRGQINKALIRGGLDGNGRFRKPEQGYSKALDILDTFDIELDEVVSSHLFSARPTGTVRVDLAFTNRSDLFSPVSITNSLLYLQFTELREGVFEVVAYLS